MDNNTIKNHPPVRKRRENWVLSFTTWIVEKWFTPHTIALYKRINRDHPKISTVGISLLYILIIVILFKILYTILKYYQIFPEVSEIEHIDMAALLCAILSIVIAFLITIYVEENHTEQTESLKDGSRLIREATDRIKEITNDMWGILLSLEPQKCLSQRLDVLEDIIQMTWDSQQNIDPELHNRMYILNYNVSYGHLQAYNASITIEEERHIPATPDTWMKYHDVFSMFHIRQSKIFNRLLTLNKESVNIAVLRTKVNNFKNQADKYERLLNKVLIENEEHKAYGYFECSTEPFDVIHNSDGKGDIYTMPISQGDVERIGRIGNKNEQQKVVKAKLIEELCRYNKERIEALSDAGVIEKIAYLDYVPFQFFMSVPKNRNKSSKQKCLLVFTNILSLEKHPTHTVSFVSENELLIQTLTDIHSTLTNNYENKEGEKQKLMELFSCLDAEPTFVLTKIYDKKNEKTDLAYLSDFAACSDLKELFSGYQIENAPIRFNDDLTIQKIGRENKTFIVIGLFGNSISEGLRFIEGKNKSCFTFSRIIKEGHGKPIEYIDETIGININRGTISTDGIRWKEFPRKEGKELAILAKVKVGGSTVIICGGLSGYGTGIIGRYIRENMGTIAERIGNENLKSESLVIIFSMPWLDKNGNEYDSRVIKEIAIEGIFY